MEYLIMTEGVFVTHLSSKVWFSVWRTERNIKYLNKGEKVEKKTTI
jgi:hypothetical protein